MSELIEQIKRALRVEDVIGAAHKLVKDGRQFVGAEHLSLNVNPQRQLWVWHSKQGGRGQAKLGGDVLSWISYEKFGTPDVEGDRFTEVLREGCRLARIEFPEKSTGGGGHSKATEQRTKREILRRFHEASERCRDKEFYVRARQIGAVPNDPAKPGKTWLTQAIIDDWHIGYSPTLPQCLKAGLTEKELRSVGLLCDPFRDGPDAAPYMFFRDCLIIPWMDAGEVVFLSMRRLVDWDGEGRPLDKSKKALSMRGPEKGGMPRPAGFNLDTLRAAAREDDDKPRDCMLVEGPLDAIACESRGHPAVALGCTSPAPELIERLGYYAGVTCYLALDGDQGSLERVRAAGKVGLYTKVCQLPDGADPDDMTGEELASVKAGAVTAIEVWCGMVAA